MRIRASTCYLFDDPPLKSILLSAAYVTIGDSRLISGTDLETFLPDCRRGVGRSFNEEYKRALHFWSLSSKDLLCTLSP
ncbi:hypothetical protein BDZ89DRAFT_1059624 [Hymenopellis radicata]|nr:hypothetical protein BDZ89DRAFT_1059624 [Hymenopellis radicata]